ncbi:MAG: class I SAM-dependent methyltransferase [Actinomycetota bacterium]
MSPGPHASASSSGEPVNSLGRDAGRSLFWSAYALVYDLIWDSPLTRKVADSVADASDDSLTRGRPTQRPVVDLGCGTGLVSRSLTERGIGVVGVDASAAMLRRAQLTGRLTRAVHADAALTRLDPGQMRAAVAVNLLHVHADPASVIAEAVRLVAPGAAIVLVWPTDDVTPTTLNRLELQLGRPRLQVASADAARLTVGLLGQIVGARRHSHQALRGAVRQAANMGSVRVCSEQVLEGCQHLLTLRATF